LRGFWTKRYGLIFFDILVLNLGWADGLVFNYGMLLNSDVLASSDSYRYFVSSEGDEGFGPRLVVSFDDGFHDADLDFDGVVDTDELRGYLDLWFLGEVSMSELLGAVNVWLS